MMRIPRASSNFPREVRAQNRRISGVTPGVTKSFTEQPWRLLPKSHSLMGMARAGKGARKGGL